MESEAARPALARSQYTRRSPGDICRPPSARRLPKEVKHFRNYYHYCSREPLSQGLPEQSAMKRSATGRASAGFAFQTFIFILATIGITAGATVAIVEAYQKWVIDARTPSELKRLTEENNALKSTVQQLQEQAKQSEEERVLEAAQVLRLTTKADGSAANPDGVTEAMKRRGLTSEENHLLD